MRSSRCQVLLDRKTRQDTEHLHTCTEYELSILTS